MSTATIGKTAKNLQYLRNGAS